MSEALRTLATLVRRIGLALLLAYASAALGADETGAPVQKPDVKVGERWLYRTMNYHTNVQQGDYEVLV